MVEGSSGARVVFGRRSPETIRQKLDHYQRELGAGTVLTGCQVGSLPHHLARKSMEMLAKDVLPKLREGRR